MLNLEKLISLDFYVSVKFECIDKECRIYSMEKTVNINNLRKPFIVWYV
jgi:hypothetical protein